MGLWEKKTKWWIFYHIVNKKDPKVVKERENIWRKDITTLEIRKYFSVIPSTEIKVWEDKYNATYFKIQKSILEHS